MSTTTALATGLGVALLALTVLMVGALRAIVELRHRLLVLESAASRRSTPAPAAAAPVAAPAPAAAATAPAVAAPVGPVVESEVVPVGGVDAAGEPIEVALDEGPWLVAFLSTTCSICVGVWERLVAGELDALGTGVRAVVVTKDPGKEDLASVTRIHGASTLPLVLSSEAWSDYEIPGSPYLLLLDGTAGSLVTEGPVRGWDDVRRMVAKLQPA